jgi:hypothetical protein
MRVLHQESGEDIEMAETYSREDLGKLKRSELRALAVSDKVGMTFQEASTARSEDMVEIILKKLGKAGDKKGAPAPKGRPAGKPAPAPEPEPVDGAEETPAEEETPEEKPEKKGGKSLKEENTVIQRLDAIGPAVEELGTSLADAVEKLNALQKQSYVALSLLKLLLGANMEPDEVDKAIDTASEEFDGGEGKD